VTLPEPDFIARDPQVITAEIVGEYERLSGKTLYPAQAERLLIDVMAYRETLVRIGIQEAAKQNLVAFARAPMLDYLGELLGVTRLPAQPALATLRFSVAQPLAASLLIPGGTRVEGSDGSVTFATDADVTLPAGLLSIDAAATCLESGTAGNAWQPGQINNLVDDLGGEDIAVTNATITAGGFDAEDDERLRERIKLAPEAFSTAGSRLAYVFHAKSAHQSIVDVAVLSPIPGKVRLYPLTGGGLPDVNLLALVEAACSAERVRPLTDTVEALAPTPVDYAIDVALTLYVTASQAAVVAAVEAAARSFVTDRAAGLARDVVPSQVIAALSVSGVYQVTVNSPSLLTLAEHEWANCTGITVSVAGVANG
jgi:phage-related baseplate assembly protein